MIKEYIKAATLEEAIYLSKQGYVFLAGGTQVNNTPFKKWGKCVEKVISIESLGLDEFEKGKDKLIVGAMISLQNLIDSPAVPNALRIAAGFIPTRSVRNIATIGGNVGANRPDSYLIPVLIALGALAELADGRSVSVEDYVADRKDDLIVRFSLPVQKGVVLSVKESRSQLALPVVSAAVHLAAKRGKVSEAVIAAGCVSSHCIRLKDIEKRLINGSLSDDPELEEAIAGKISPKADILGSERYKTYINSVRIADTIRNCLKEVLS